MSEHDSKKYIIAFKNNVNIALMRELIDEFLPPKYYEILELDKIDINLKGAETNTDNRTPIIIEGSDRDEAKREIFLKLAELTEKKPEYGALTGVRPVKLAGELMKKTGSREAAIDRLVAFYLMDRSKARWITDIYEHQMTVFGMPKPGTVALYIGIPFCPTRCLYCSFASNQEGDDEICAYMKALMREIRFVASNMNLFGMMPESIFIGGGTPTTLNEEQLDELMSTVSEEFDLSELREYTVEAGRPDTITTEKLNVIKAYGADRVCINPQTMHQKTLDIIGRKHSPEEIEKAILLTHAAGFDDINADIIAGLPGENTDDFKYSLDSIIKTGVSEVTVHTLAVKRASKLKEIDENYHYKAENAATEMLEHARSRLNHEGFSPYYLYRQKHMAGAHENTGYAKPGHGGLYNVRIMDEHQTVIALGAGGISKVYYPDTNRLTRVPNVTNFRQYIDRIDEMCDRKQKGIFNK